MNTPPQLFAPLFLLLAPSWEGWKNMDGLSREQLKSRGPGVSLWMAKLSVPVQLLPTWNAGTYTSPDSGGWQCHFESIAAASYCFWSFCPAVLNSGLFFFFFASSFHNIIQTGWIFSSIKWHITLPSYVINFMDFSISCHDEPKFSIIIRLWLCISRHLMSVPITKIYHVLNLMASARGSFRLFQCGLSFLKSINSFVFKASFNCSLSGSSRGQNIAFYIQWFFFYLGKIYSRTLLWVTLKSLQESLVR